MDLSPALGRLVEALDAIDEPAWCEGVTPAAGIAIDVPDAGTCTTDEPRALLDWLTTRAEPAPFGHAGKTKLDAKVRSTLRVKARGRTRITGLDLDAIVEGIADALAAKQRVVATLADVLVYPVGGKFLKHKDTPRTADQLGTLIVELPVPHRGGQLTFDDGRDRHAVDWSAPSDQLRWVAMFGDVDHAIAEVTFGARVTAVYSLALSSEARTDPQFAARLDTVADAMIAVIADRDTLPDGGDLIVPCVRMIVAPFPPTAPLALDVLRGHDRTIADTLARCGARVRVREFVFATESKSDAMPEYDNYAMQVVKPIPPRIFAAANEAGALSFVDDAGGEYLDEAGDAEVPSIEGYVKHIDGVWLVRRDASAKLVYEGLLSETGYFGNECSEGFVYQCATLEVHLEPYAERIGGAAARAKPKQVAAKRVAKPTPKPKRAAKAKRTPKPKPAAKAKPKRAAKTPKRKAAKRS